MAFHWKEKVSFPVFFFFFKSLKHISMDSWIPILLIFHLFWCSNHPRTLSKLALVPLFFFFTAAPSFFDHLPFLLFGTRFFVLILYFQCPSPGINHFIREIWFLLLEDVFRKQDLDTRYVPCYWGVTVLRLSLRSEVEYCFKMYPGFKL